MRSRSTLFALACLLMLLPASRAGAEPRAFEQVSPPDKNGGGALSGALHRATVAANGAAVQYYTSSIFGDPPPAQVFSSAPYVSRRTPTGWRTRAPVPFVCRTALEEAGPIPIVLQNLVFAPDLERATLTQPEAESCPLPPLDPAAPRPSHNLYLEDLLTDPPAYTLLAPEPAFPQAFATLAGVMSGYSVDFGHVVYASSGNQTADSPPPASFFKLYEWEGGTLRLVSKDPAGDPFLTESAVPFAVGVNGVSESGDRIFFQNPASLLGGCEAATPCELYMREDGARTYDVSQSECTASCGASYSDVFDLAAADGSRVLFSSVAKLSDDDSAGLDLYLYAHSDDPVADRNLTVLSRDEEPADGSDAALRGVVGASSDLRTVFFVADGQILPGEDLGPGPKLYRWRLGQGTELLATLADADEAIWGGTGGIGHRSRVTPDGTYLEIETVRQLDPAADGDADADLYRWDQGDGWLCLSCQPPGAPSSGDASGPTAGDNLGGRPLSISDDGQTVFFTTPDALLPADRDGEVRDVYEWHGGDLGLVSSGTAPSDVELLGFSRSGGDVFFYTEESLVGWDTDQAGDIYDARAGGGFPEPPPAGTPCDGGACRGAATIPPATDAAATASFAGPGNRPRVRRCPRGTRRVRVKGTSVCRRRKGPERHRRRHASRQAGAERGPRG